MAPKKQTIEEKQGYNAEAPDTSCDELIAQLIADMEKLDVKSMDKDQVVNLLNATKKIVKTWNDKDKMTPEERKKMNEIKAKERADEKKRLTAEKREKVFTVNFIFKGSTYQIEVLATDTLPSLRAEFLHAIGIKLKRKDIKRLIFHLGEKCLNKNPRKEAINIGLFDGATIDVSMIDTTDEQVETKASASTDIIQIADEDDEEDDTDED